MTENARITEQKIKPFKFTRDIRDNIEDNIIIFI